MTSSLGDPILADIALVAIKDCCFRLSSLGVFEVKENLDRP
jgi:hypothetical protein